MKIEFFTVPTLDNDRRYRAVLVNGKHIGSINPDGKGRFYSSGGLPRFKGSRKFVQAQIIKSYTDE